MITNPQIQVIQHFKAGTGGEIPIFREHKAIGKLRAATVHTSTDTNLMKITSQWRNKYIKELMTDKTATLSTTTAFFRDYLPSENSRIQFFLYTLDNQPIGHIALSHIQSGSVELGNGILGESIGPQLIFEYAERSLIQWCYSTLNVEWVYLKVRRDNIAARWVNKKIGLRVLVDNDVARLGVPRDEYHENEVANIIYMGLNAEAYKAPA